MTDKMAATYQFAHVDTTLVIYYPIASKFHIWVTFIKLSPKFKYGLCPITKVAAKMAATCGHSNLVIYHPISSKFHILITFIKLLHKFEYGYWLMNTYGQLALVDTLT